MNFVGLMTLDWNAVAALSSLLIAIVGYTINRSINLREERTQRHILLAEYRKEIISFSKEFFDIISEVIHQIDSDGDSDAVRGETSRLSKQLSGLADTGRFFFPNDTEGRNAFGFSKGPAFAGVRRPPLDAILAAHLAVEAFLATPERKQSLLDASLTELLKTKQPLTKPTKAADARYLLVQARRSYLNAVVPDTFPKEWRRTFSELLGPISDE